MLSRRLQLPQSLTRRRQWQLQGKLQSRQLSRTLSHSTSRTQPSPATRSETAQSSQTDKKTASSSPATLRGVFSPAAKASKLESQRHKNAGLKRRLGGGLDDSEYLGSSFVSLKRRDTHGLFSQPKKPSSPSSSSSSSSSLLSDEFASWIDGPDAHAALHKEKEGTGGGNGRVLVLESASRYLAESDFYRLATQGQHVDGWVHGITKVIQARSPVTLQPQGKYFLFFDKPASAQAYLQKVLDLHAKVRQIAAQNLIESNQEKEVEAEPDSDVDIPALLREYTLLPPGASLKINRPSEEKIHEVLLRQQQQQQQPNQRTATKQGDTKEVTKPAESKPHRREWWADDDVDPPKPAQKETLDLSSLDLPMEQNKVLLRLSRSKLTMYGLRWAIDADSKRRNLPWRLQASPPTPTPPQSSPSNSSSFPASPIQPLAYSKQTVKYSQWNSTPNQSNKTGNVTWIDHYTSQQQQQSDPSASDSPDTSSYERHPLSSTPEETSYFSTFKYPSQSWTKQDQSWLSLDAHEVDADGDEDGHDGWENKGSPGKHDAKHQGYGSFVVSFADVHEARRFAREWHKRKVWDHRTERWITVDATWLW